MNGTSLLFMHPNNSEDMLNKMKPKLKEREQREMKKKVMVAMMLVATVAGLTACNQTLIDTTYTYDRAIISLPNGEIVEGKVTSWTDFEDSDQIQVKIDGKTYLVHSTNIVLISE